MKGVIENCPWYDQFIYWGAPTVDWCEAATCSPLVNPSLALSNISYLIVAILIFKNSRGALGKTMGITVLLIAGCSFIYHSIENAFGQYLDFIGIFLLCSFIFLMTIKKIYPKSGKRKTLGFFIGLNIIFFCIKLSGFPIQLSLLPPFLLAAYFEIPIIRKHNLKLKNLYWSILYMALGGLASAMDVGRVFCDPHDHIFQLHSLWHFLSALSIYYYYLYLRGNKRLKYKINEI